MNGAFDAVVHGGMAVSYVIAGPAVALLGARGVYVAGGLAALAGVAFAARILRAAVPGRTKPVEGQPTAAELLLP